MGPRIRLFSHTISDGKLSITIEGGSNFNNSDFPLYMMVGDTTWAMTLDDAIAIARAAKFIARRIFTHTSAASWQGLARCFVESCKSKAVRLSWSSLASPLAAKSIRSISTSTKTPHHSDRSDRWRRRVVCRI